jgi:His/Glu/Gln/Arg/opine family amino acid ABC transporter permease subunit
LACREVEAISDRWRKVSWSLGSLLAVGLLVFGIVYLTSFERGKEFVDEFLKWQTIKDTFWYIFTGLRITISVALVSEVFILVAGLLVALVRISRVKLFRGMAAVYIDVIRGIPLLLQIFIVYYGVAILGFKMNIFWAGVLALTICYAAYEAEIFRAGIESIHKGQMEAARSLGMGYFKAMRYIVLPQAVRNVIPPLSNEFIALLKDTALLSVIGLAEVTRRASEMFGREFNITPFVVGAICYLIVTIPLMRLVQYITKRFSVSE